MQFVLWEFRQIGYRFVQNIFLLCQLLLQLLYSKGVTMAMENTVHQAAIQKTAS